MTSLALFDEPLRVSINQPSAAGGSRVGLLLGMMAGEHGLEGVVCFEDGTLGAVSASWFSIDFRYDPEIDRFVDQGIPKPDQEV